MCIEHECEVDGNCTEYDDDICQGYFCLTKNERVKVDGTRCYCKIKIGQVVSGEGRDCTSCNDPSPDCSISGTFCDPTYHSCYRSYDKPKVIYNNGLDHECVNHFDCLEGLYCARNVNLRPGTCEACLVDGDCPEKILPNYPICKRGEHDCPDVCLTNGERCWPTDTEKGKCCLGLKCIEEHCHPCKMTGTCVDDSDYCENYACLNGTVVYPVGQKCYIENGKVSVNCTDGMFCDIATNKCYRPNEAAPRVIYNPVGHDCMYHFDCEEGLYCAQHPTRDGRKICSVCQVAEGCPEKGNQSNYNKTCKRGEYKCPDICLHENDQWRTTSGGAFGKTIKVGDCCRGMKWV